VKPNRQNQQNLVYWPVGMMKTPKSNMTNPEALLTDSQNRWQVHLRAVAETRDKYAFKALYIHFAPKIKSFYIQQGMVSLAEELTHEVFLRVWQKAATYQPGKAQVSTWIFTIVRNLKIDYLRKKRIDAVNEELVEEPSEENDFPEQVELSRHKKELSKNFALLNQEQKNVLQKVYFEDKSHQIAATELKMTLGTVKSRIRSAISLLRSQMGDEK